jgi:hypothetical protein
VKTIHSYLGELITVSLPPKGPLRPFCSGLAIFGVRCEHRIGYWKVQIIYVTVIVFEAANSKANLLRKIHALVFEKNEEREIIIIYKRNVTKKLITFIHLCNVTKITFIHLFNVTKNKFRSCTYVM